MIVRFNGPGGEDGHDLAALTTELRVRVLNVSAQGGLVETNRRLEIGSAATLRLAVTGCDFEDTVRVVRCEEITGARDVYHVGLAFLTTEPASIQSLRYLLRHEGGRSIGWMRITEKD